MKLISLELTNYRRFKKILIEFPEGVIGILGLNGVGKSTIIEAVAWVLYGNQQTIVRTKKEDLKRHGAPAAEECLVKLTFDLVGDKYLITRLMAGKNYSTSAEVSVNGKLEATSTKAVTALIEQRLGMDYQAFYTSVFAKQKELNALSDIEPNKRKKLILRMLNIDSIDKAIISVHSDKKTLKTKLEENRLLLSDQEGKPKIELYQNQIKEQKEEAKSYKKNLAELVELKDKLNAEVISLGKRREQQRKLRDEFNKIKTESTAASTNLENLVAQRKKVKHDLDELINQEKDLKELQPKKVEWEKVKKRKTELESNHAKYVRAQELELQLNRVVQQLKNHEQKLKQNREQNKKIGKLEEEFKDFQSSKSKLEQEMDEKKRLHSELNTKLDQIKNEILKLTKKLKDVKKLGPDSECPTCERVLGEHYKILEEKFDQELEGMNNEMNNIEQAIEGVKKELEDVKKRQDALNKRENYLKQQAEQRAKIEGSIKASEAEVEHYRAQEKELGSNLKELKKIKFDPVEFDQIKVKYGELEKFNEKIITLSERVENIPKFKDDLDRLNESEKDISNNLTKLKKQLTKLGFDEKILKELELKFDVENKKLKEYELTLKDMQNKLDLTLERVEQLSERITELKELEKKIDEFKDDLMYLTKLDFVMNKFKNYMISRIAPTLTMHASDLFRGLTDGKYNRLEVDNDYDVYLYDDGTPFPLNRYSGGEEDLANLCLRLAISEVITAQVGTSNLNFIILDEVFGSQDLHRKRNLLQALNGLTNKFRQIFLITHIEDVKDFIEFNIHVTENDDGTSSVKTMA